MADNCIFCKIAAKTIPSVALHEDDELLAFLDIAPIRKGHTCIIARKHYETFELLPRDLAAKMVSLGQDLARRMKSTYRVERVAFFFTGTDIAHAHAHVVPMHEKTDVTSARYIQATDHLSWSSAHLRVEPASLQAVKKELGF